MNENFQIVMRIIFAFILGAISLWGFQEMTKPTPAVDQEFFDDIFDDQFFDRSHSPFQEMDRIRERMDKLFREPRELPDFDGWFDDHYGQFPLNQITTREDDEYVYYVLDVGNKDVANIEVESSNGYLSITAELKEGNSSFASSTQLEQRFPIPGGVIPDSLKTEQQGEEIIISFRKKK